MLRQSFGIPLNSITLFGYLITWSEKASLLSKHDIRSAQNDNVFIIEYCFLCRNHLVTYVNFWKPIFLLLGYAIVNTLLTDYYLELTKQTLTCLKSTIETQGVKYAHS